MTAPMSYTSFSGVATPKTGGRGGGGEVCNGRIHILMSSLLSLRVKRSAVPGRKRGSCQSRMLVHRMRRLRPYP